jgi:thiol-disulfide isomerase/thioredoxin
VEMNFQSLDDKGIPIGGPTEVPVVIMQAVGKGAQSTHYGNNAVMPAGLYTVSVVVNGSKSNLKINVSDIQGDAMPATSGKVILFFMNPHGHPCQMQLSILDGMKEKLLGLATITYIKTTESGDQETFYHYGIRGLPSLIILDNSGKEIKRFAPGIQDEKTILSALKNPDK